MHKLFAWQVSKVAAREYAFGSSSIQGRRPSQEDRALGCQLQGGGSKEGCSFYAVYDGHGGPRAATYCTEVMHTHLVRSSSYKAGDMAQALRDAFAKTEREFLNMAGVEGWRDGTTAVCAVIQEGAGAGAGAGSGQGTLTVAHVGDSRAVLCRAGHTVSITEDHKPDSPDEKARIEGMGGFVSHIGCWRAMGVLAMSRAIGDLFLKPYVGAAPDVVTMPLTAADEFLVLASDGIFDVFENDQVVHIVRSADTPESAAKQLTSAAFSAGSLDNCTAVVVALQGYKAGVGFTPADFIPSPRELPTVSPPTSYGVKPITPAFDFIPSPRELPLSSPLEGDERGIGYCDGGMRGLKGVGSCVPPRRDSRQAAAAE